jgi:anti-sigma regulatory factor (Ser/Thr protein kinase)
VIHGNLDIPGSKRAELDWSGYDRLIAQREQQAPYSKRRVRVLLTLARASGMAELRITDEGSGFAPPLDEQEEVPEVMEESGRGLFLIQRVMDHTAWTDQGRTIIMQRQVASTQT